METRTNEPATGPEAAIPEVRWRERLGRLGLRGKLPTKLTQAVVDATRSRPQSERYELPDGDVPGLVLRVGADGTGAFSLLYRNAAGKRCRLGLGTSGDQSLEEARHLAQQARVKVAQGVDPAAERHAAREAAVTASKNTVRAYLLNTYAPLVLAHQRRGGGLPDPSKPKSKGTGNYARIMSAWAPLLDVPIASITREQIEKVLADRKAAKKAAGTLIRDWSSFRAMLADAVDRGVLAAIPSGVKRPTPIRKAKGNERVRWLGQFDTPEEAAGAGERKRFLDALDGFEGAEHCSGDFLRFVCRLALATGMRRGEIVRLTNNMIDLSARKVTLPKEITKSDKTRTVSLNRAAIAALNGWTLRGKKGELFPPEEQQTTEQAAVMWRDRITQQGFPALCTAAGIEDLHFHDLRHDFAVRLLRSGATFPQVRDALGHASVTQTEKYAHVLQRDVDDAVLRMDAAG